MVLNLRILIIGIFITFFNTAEAQIKDQNSKVEKLNEYVNYTNESVHGLLIVHRMLENFNKNINKYVDLPDQKLNFYTNKDLPADIFQDEEDWFYNTSPNEWYTKIMSGQGSLTTPEYNKLNIPVKDMKTVLVDVNKIRFDLEQLINTLDLTKRENQSIVYDKLEEGVSLYKAFFVKQKSLETEIANIYKANSFATLDEGTKTFATSLDQLYNEAKSVLICMYNKEGELISPKVKAHEAALQKFKAVNTSMIKNQNLLTDKRLSSNIANIVRLSEDAIKEELAFEQALPLPNDYKEYDKYYYYYNISAINKFNRYGNGIVFEYNRILSTLGKDMLLEFELPHYFKVIYPEKLEKTDRLVASDPMITTLPVEMMDRSVVKADRKILVDNYEVDFKIYDHKIIDKDVVSISYNGDWILENFEISATKKDLKVQLNKVGKNYLLLYAIDEGRNPPATVALSYKYQGKAQTIILNSDKSKSEMIEIEVIK